MPLTIRGAQVAYGDRIIFQNANFEIRDREKIAVVGRNGCGKTTLLKLLAGEIDFVPNGEPKDSFFSVTNEPVIGYLRQAAFSDDSLTMEQELRKELAGMEARKKELAELSAALQTTHTEEAVLAYTEKEEAFKALGGYYYEKEFDTLIRKFGFSDDDRKKPLSDFSGGQRTKIAFIRLLLKKPDILLLDEPTNHLDADTIEWLEKTLQNYEKAIVLVSHDRMFLDRVVSVVYEISNEKLKRYPGNYTAFVRQKKELYEHQKKEYLAQQKEIKRLTELVERFKAKPTKAAMARSKLKAIEHMDLVEPPDPYDEESFHSSFQPETATGNDVLSVQDLVIGYDRSHPLQKINLELKRGERIGIIGENGIGKSTFLKTLVSELPALGGDFHYGVHVRLGYFDQQLAQISTLNTVLQEFWDTYPDLTETEARTALGAFLFKGEDVYKEVEMLSGGEKVRLSLCKILKAKPNVLLLDEPTNHMDIQGKETLEHMLSDYEGTLVFVSHDRYFVKKLATRILLFEKGGVSVFPFGYEEYEEKRQAAALAAEANGSFDGSDRNASAKAAEKDFSAPAKNKDRIYGKERSRLEKKLKKAEEALADAEKEADELKSRLADPAIQTDYEALGALQEEIDAADEKVLACMETWDELTQALAALNEGEQG